MSQLLTETTVPRALAVGTHRASLQEGCEELLGSCTPSLSLVPAEASGWDLVLFSVAVLEGSML